MKKKQLLLPFVMATTVLLAACGSNATSEPTEDDNSNSTTEETYAIGMSQIVEHASLDDARTGFQDALADNGLVEGKNVTYDYQNAQNDPSTNTTIAQNLVSASPDLIFANSTPSAQALLSATSEIPIIFTSVTDPVGSQLVPSLEEPDANITGTMDAHPDAIPNTLSFIKDELGGTNIGLLYNAGEQNSVAQVNNVETIMEDLGLTAVKATVSSSADVKQAAESLVGQIDAFYIVTDNTVVSAIETVVDVANTADIPLLTAELDSIGRGAFAAYGFNYYDIGYEAGQIAAEILLEGKQPSDFPVQYPQNLKLVINKTAAEEMGVELKDSWDDIAEYVE